MGALTLKTYPFELRGWEIQKFTHFDPTDSFIYPTVVYLNKNNIVQIEPFFDNNWLNDKARHFFDTFFEIYFNNNQIQTNWFKLYSKILTKIYTFEHCSRQINRNYFFIVVFDYLSIELLGLLIFISKNYSFVNLKQVQPFKNINTDFESNFQVNSLITNKKTLINSNFCFLIATNPRYEGNVLNLTLRQRVLKKNFKCILIGSIINLTFPTLFFGTNTNIIKTITEGNNFICQNVKYSINPFLVYNTELFKKTDSKTISSILKMLFYFKYFNSMWCGYNILSLSVSNIGMLMLNQTAKLTSKNLNNFSLIYFININVGYIGYIKKIIELNLFNQTCINNLDCLTFFNKTLILDQNYIKNNNLQLSNKVKADYLHIPINTFYENNSTFINTEGFIKKTNKIIYKNKIKSNWHILRKLINYFKNKLIFLNRKDNQSIFVNLKKFYNFKNYINFSYCPIKKLAYLSCLLTNKNKVFIISNFKLYFKTKVTKFKVTKLKYCLNDFFNSHQDQYSQHSVLLASCSKQIKFQITNFF